MNKRMVVHIGMTCWGSQKALTPTYIHVHCLATANGAYRAQSYGYDANGNRSSATLNGVNNSYTNAVTSNRLQSISGAVAKTYQYDANGNITNDGLHTYSYDARNRLVGLNTGVSYSLNGLGQRVSKTIAGIDTTNTTAGDANGDGSINAQDYSAILNHILGTPASNDADCNQDTQVNVQDLVCINIKINPALQTAGGKTLFVYDEQGQLIGEYDQTGAVIQETIYLGNLPVAVVKNNVVYRLYADHLNTPRAIADSSNKVLWSWNSDAFGTTAANEDPDGDGVKLAYNLRFPGQYFDSETGLHYNYFRDYDPSTGRYRESDPIGLDGGLNTYLYAESNPKSYIDPYGLWSWGDPLPQGIVDASAGFGDVISFGGTYLVREAMDTNNTINFCSNEYAGGAAAGVVVHVIGFRTGGELKLGNNWRIAPWGNRTGNEYGRWPHYHRRGEPDATGRTPDGQGISRHRPWQPSPHDKTWGDRF